jgi:hypothetical protein
MSSSSKWVDTVSVERDGFRIKVPDSWWEFEIRPETREDSIRQMLDLRLKANPEMAEHRDVIQGFLRRQAKEAWDSGAAYIGCMAETFGGEIPITASMTVSLISARSEGGGSLSTDPSDIAGQLKSYTARKKGDPWRKVTTVEIPGVGTTARTYGVEDIKFRQDPRQIRVVMMQTYVPMPGSANKIALVSGSSQVVDLADSLFEVFDAVTSTFRFA